MRKYVIFAMAAIFMLSATLTAQPQPQPQQGHMRGDKKEFKQDDKKMITPEKRAEFMAKQLQLSDAEKAKVQDLFVKQDAKRKQQLEEIKKLKEEQKAKFEANRKAQEDDLIKIIGNEKFRQLQAMHIARLEKENRMLKMKRMSCQAPQGKGQQSPMMEKMKKMRMEKMKKGQEKEQ